MPKKTSCELPNGCVMEPLVAEQVLLENERNTLLKATGKQASERIVAIYLRLAEIEGKKASALPTICSQCVYR